MLKFIFLVLLITTGCSTRGPSRQVKTFIQSYEDQYNPKDPRFLDVYQRYLASVERLYNKEDKKTEFRSYLDSLNSNSQVLSNQKQAMPDLYKKKTGRSVADASKRDYVQFRRREINDLADKLYSARELKIKDEAGDELYEKLEANYTKFIKIEQAENLNIPL